MTWFSRKQHDKEGQPKGGDQGSSRTVEDRIRQAAPAYEVGPSHSTPPQLYSKHHSETLLIVISKNSLYSLCVYFSARTLDHFSNQMLHTQGKKTGQERAGSIKQDSIQKTQAVDRSTVTATHLHLSSGLYHKEKKRMTPQTNHYQQIALPLGRSQAGRSLAGTSTCG